jgi:hypothetical protein
VRIKTARSLRSIDAWKGRLSERKSSFPAGMVVLLSTLASSPRAKNSRKAVIVPLLILLLIAQFGAVEAGILVLLGLLTLKLQTYRLVNTLLRLRFL